MRLPRISAVALAALLFSVSPAAARLVDPALRFRTLHTEHFVVYFHQGEERLARRLASLVEDVRTSVGRALMTTPPRLTHVILADQSEIANGWATPLPRNTIFLNATAPSGAESIGRTDDWLRVVFTHEFTHIVHLDRSGGWARIARGLLGRSLVAFPNMWLPQWQVEGLATWEESALTGSGRLGAGDFRAIERVAAAERRPLTLDRAGGGLVNWPAGLAPYSAGLGFHDYLARTYGEDSLARLAASTARQLPFFGARSFRRVFGQPLGVLWQQWLDESQPSAVPLQILNATRLTHTPFTRLTAPRFLPPACPACSQEVVYSSQSPDGFPSIRAVTLDGHGDRELALRYLGSTHAASLTSLVFDQYEVRRNAGLYSDLYVLDRLTGRVRALTTEARLRDPDLSPDGRTIAAVRERGGQRDLVLVHLPSPLDRASDLDANAVTTLVAQNDVQFSAPRWSPDGRTIAVERRVLGSLPGVVLVDATDGRTTRVFAATASRIVTPAWHPGGDAIVAAADLDGGSFDLYEFPLDEARPIRRLTRTRGALWPDVALDGSSLVFAGYGVDGYGVFFAPYVPREAITDGSAPPVVPVAVPAAQGGQTIEPLAPPYRPLSTLPPTSWTPILTVDADQVRLGGQVAGNDVLGRHAYALDLSWLADASVPAALPDRSVPDWNLSYAYTRWRPVVFGAVARSTRFELIGRSDTSADVPAAVVKRDVSAGVVVPFVHVRHRMQLSGSVLRSDQQLPSAPGIAVPRLVSARFALADDTSRSYGYSISREHGANVGATVEIARHAFGSRVDATTATLDSRVYVKGLRLHHVLALRMGLGFSTGDAFARRSFRLGAVAASPSVVDFGSAALGLVRGAGGEFIGGPRATVGNVEYRLPLFVVERGHGTWPLFVKTVHLAVFADAGRTTDPGRQNRPWQSGVGGELSIDGTASFSRTFVATVGVAWGREGRSSRGASVYARLGRAF